MEANMLDSSWKDTSGDSCGSWSGTTNDALTVAVEPLPSWDGAGCSGNDGSMRPNRTGSVENERAGGKLTPLGRFVAHPSKTSRNELESRPQPRRGISAGKPSWNGDSGPRRKCSYYEEEERFWRERLESCRAPQDAADAREGGGTVATEIPTNLAVDDTPVGARARARVHPGTPESGTVDPWAIKRTTMGSLSSPHDLREENTKQPERFGSAGVVKEARAPHEGRRVSGGWPLESRDVGRQTDRRYRQRPASSAGNVSWEDARDDERWRRGCPEEKHYRGGPCRWQQHESIRLCALRDAERTLNAILVAEEGGDSTTGPSSVLGPSPKTEVKMAVRTANTLDPRQSATLLTAQGKRGRMLRHRAAVAFYKDLAETAGSASSLTDRAPPDSSMPSRRQQKRFPYGPRDRSESSAVPAAAEGCVFSSGNEGGYQWGVGDGCKERYPQRNASSGENIAGLHGGVGGDRADHCGLGGFCLTPRESHPLNERASGEDGDEVEEAALMRVGDLSRRVALRCLHVEQECLRRERAQTRLFQEQIRGIRQAAQDLARRAIRTERSRTEKLVAAAQKEFERKKKALVAQREREEEDWKAERDALNAGAAASRLELDKTKRLSREIAESLKRDGEKALEKQRMELQRSWVAEKGGLRRAAEDALRRAVGEKARAGEEAAKEAKTLRDSLEAQVRSWRAKADAAEKRLAEERERRRGLEAGEESRDNLADLVKEAERGRQAQETLLRELTTKAESDRKANAQEKELLQEQHRAHLARFLQDKKVAVEAERRRWQQEMEELRAQANVKASEALARAKEERTEASRRLRLAHDAEMRKAGRDILRLEREIRRLERSESPVGGKTARSMTATLALSPLPRRNCGTSKAISV